MNKQELLNSVAFWVEAYFVEYGNQNGVKAEEAAYNLHNIAYSLEREARKMTEEQAAEYRRLLQKAGR